MNVLKARREYVRRRRAALVMLLGVATSCGGAATDPGPPPPVLTGSWRTVTIGGVAMTMPRVHHVLIVGPLRDQGLVLGADSATAQTDSVNAPEHSNSTSVYSLNASFSTNREFYTVSRSGPSAVFNGGRAAGLTQYRAIVSGDTMTLSWMSGESGWPVRVLVRLPDHITAGTYNCSDATGAWRLTPTGQAPIRTSATCSEFTETFGALTIDPTGGVRLGNATGAYSYTPTSGRWDIYVALPSGKKYELIGYALDAQHLTLIGMSDGTVTVEYGTIQLAKSP